MDDSVEHLVAAPDGLALFVREYPAQGGENGLPVLCIHGLTRNSRDFELVAPRIAALGRRVLAVDVRGRGHSDRDPDPARYQVPIYAEDMAQIMDELGAPRAVFVGTSMGGLITMGLAHAAPERVAAAILNDVGAIVEMEGLKRIAAYVGHVRAHASWEEAIAAIRAAQAVNFPDADEAFWGVFARRVCREADGQIVFDYDPAIGEAFAQAVASPLDVSPVFAALQPVPTLVIRGALSDLLSPEGVAKMRAIKPDLEVVETPRVGHAPTLEEPQAWDAMIDFLARAA